MKQYEQRLGCLWPRHDAEICRTRDGSYRSKRRVHLRLRRRLLRSRLLQPRTSLRRWLPRGSTDCARATTIESRPRLLREHRITGVLPGQRLLGRQFRGVIRQVATAENLRLSCTHVDGRLNVLVSGGVPAEAHVRATLSALGRPRGFATLVVDESQGASAEEMASKHLSHAHIFRTNATQQGRDADIDRRARRAR